MSDDILTRRSGPVFEVILNRPGDGNAATDAMAAARGRTGLLADRTNRICSRFRIATAASPSIRLAS